MMRSTNIISALAFGISLSAPIPALAQDQLMPPISFQESGTFCGFMVLCKSAPDSMQPQYANGVAMLEDPTQTGNAGKANSGSVLAQPRAQTVAIGAVVKDR